jgi:hypothetical protein
VRTSSFFLQSKGAAQFLAPLARFWILTGFKPFLVAEVAPSRQTQATLGEPPEAKQTGQDEQDAQDKRPVAMKPIL